MAFLRGSYGALAARGRDGLRAALLATARARLTLIVFAAALLPIAFVIVQGSTMYDGIRHVLFVDSDAGADCRLRFRRLIPLLRRFPVSSAIAGTAYSVYAVVTLVMLHPLQYLSFNVLAGGVHGAYGRFDMDYWSIAANTALRRLESRLDPKQFAANPPSLMICIAYREEMVTPMYRRPWRLAAKPDNADYVIESQRWPCVEQRPFLRIDEVRRSDRAFAWTYARQPSAQGAQEPRLGP